MAGGTVDGLVTGSKRALGRPVTRYAPTPVSDPADHGEVVPTHCRLVLPGPNQCYFRVQACYFRVQACYFRQFQAISGSFRLDSVIFRLDSVIFRLDSVI